jgi:RNA polymerase sigma-70 factor (ECF subfamily)
MVRWLQTRERRDLAEKIEASRERLYRVAFRLEPRRGMLADDLAQETLARGLARLDQLREAERLSSWLFSILHRCWIDHLRGRRDDLDEEALTELPADLPGPEPRGSAGNGAAGAQPPSQALPLGQRQVVTLVDLEEFTYAEVAEVLAIPIGTVMSRLCRAREALRGLLEAAAAAAAPEEREMNDKRNFPTNS